jgi:uncharacterized protein involved in exopolysaccharide biosynthesis
MVSNGNDDGRSPTEQESRRAGEQESRKAGFNIYSEYNDQQSDTTSKKEIKESQAYPQIRPQMSAFFFTASSRHRLGRRLRRRLGRRNCCKTTR